MRDWLRIAAEPAVVRRALKTAALVGALLIAINHGEALVHGPIDRARLLRIALTLLVPYAVSTSSSVAALRSMRVASAAAEAPRSQATRCDR